MSPTKRPPQDPEYHPLGDREPLAPGRRILDVRFDLEGEIVDHARQYAHPNADPVFVYLVRWDDGQVRSITEHALEGRHDYELLD